MKTCSIDGCGLPVKARGWCNKHWIRWKKYENPIAGGYDRQSAKDFFFNDVLKCSEDSCLIWPFSTYSTGYGRIGLSGKRVVVSREACRVIHGEPPNANYDAAHSCGNGHLGCVNPKHLSWKTRSQNHADKVIHNTHNRGERCSLTKISEKDAVEIKRLISNGVRNVDIVTITGASRSTVEHIKAGNSWAWL